MDGWMAYYNLDPFGDARDDLRMARTCEVIARSAGTKKISAADFMFKFDEAAEDGPVAPEKLESFFMGVASAIEMAGGTR